MNNQITKEQLIRVKILPQLERVSDKLWETGQGRSAIGQKIDKIKKGYEDVYFVDDSHKNVKAVGELRQKYPNVTFKIQHVVHNGKPFDQRNNTSTSKQSDEKPPIPKTDWEEFKNKSPKEKKSILDKTIKNSDTGRNIKISSALNYDKQKDVYKAALRYLKTK